MGGIKLKRGDRVVAACVVAPGSDKLELAIISADGYARRTAVGEYPVQGRDGQGVQSQLGKTAGNLAGAVLLGPNTGALAAVLAGGGTKRLPLNAFAAGARVAAGKAAVATVAGDTVERLIVLPAATGPAPEPKGGAGAPDKPTRTRTTKPADTAPNNTATPNKAVAPKGDPKGAPGGNGTRAAAKKGAAASTTIAGGKESTAAPETAATSDKKSAAEGAKPAAKTAAAAEVKGAPPGAPHDAAAGATSRKKEPGPEIGNLFGATLPVADGKPDANAETAKTPPASTAKSPGGPTRSPRPRGTPEAGSVARPPAHTGQLPFPEDDEDDPPPPTTRKRR
jgi:hypothetical protein